MNYIYNSSTGTLVPSPRSDGLPVVGLVPPLVELVEVVQEQPEYDAATERLVPLPPEIDVPAGTVTRGWAVEPIERQPQWQAFRATLRAMPEIQEVLRQLNELDRVAFLGLGVGLGQAAQGELATFNGVWSELLAVGAVPAALAESVATLAIAHHLPTDFVQALNPAPVEPE
jgi:hypothetical protein